MYKQENEGHGEKSKIQKRILKESKEKIAINKFSRDKTNLERQYR